MYIKTLQLESVRNLQNIAITSDPGINFLYGDNGAGKTSVLEGIYIISRGRSFRPSRGNDWISRTKKTALLAVELSETEFQPDGHNESLRLGVQRERKNWRARLAGVDIKSQTELAKVLPVCLFEPETHQLILGGPEHRRRLLDWSVFHVEHEYLTNWRRYQRSLKQRNHALRNRADRAIIDSISQGMHVVAEQLTTQRQVFFDGFQRICLKLLPEFAAESLSLSLKLMPGWDISKGLRECWESELSNDLERGFTHSGPHRADIQIHSDGKSARNWLSRGQQKLVALVLVLSQQAAMMQDKKPHPVLLLDDLQSELDQERYQCLLNYLQTVPNQVWLTGVNQPDKHKINQMFHVKHGQIVVV